MCFSRRENVVYVADTYNHKIKRIDVTTNHCETYNILDESKNVMVFNEPGGLCVDPTGHFLYIANTNNHTIEMVDLSTMVAKQLKISFNTNSVPDERHTDDQSLKLTTVKMSPRGGELKFVVTLNLSSDISFTTGAPQKWWTKLPDERWSIKNDNGSNFEQQPLHLELSVSSSGLLSDNITVSFQLNLCATDVCFSKRFVLQIPVTFSDDGLETINDEISINVSRDSVQL